MGEWMLPILIVGSGSTCNRFTRAHTHIESLIKPIHYKTFLNKMLRKSRIWWIVHTLIPFHR